MAYGKDYSSESYEQDRVSKLNAAGLINSTLERLWVDSYNAMSKGDYLLWNTKLDCIWAILGGDVKDGGDEDNGMLKINSQIYKFGNLKSKVGSGFSKKDNPDVSKVYHFLMKKALFLRRLQNNQGKGTAYLSEDEDEID